MARVKAGTTTNRRHKKVLDLAKGYWMSRSKQFKKAKEAVLHAGQYAFAGRKLKKRDMRSLWITRINAALKVRGVRYNDFIHTMKDKNIIVDRKILAKIALEHPQVFESVITHVQK
ncbi:50S ribosomal protein L20 [soil metagenome]